VSIRVVYFGSPAFAVPALRELSADPAFEVALVVTQTGKGRSPVERAAGELELPVYRPQSLRETAARDPLVAVDADIFIVAAFGLIFGQRTLEIPRFGAVNIHPSLLPQYRGASPIAAAIAAGDTATGVSLMQMDASIDTGAVISVERAEIACDDTSESLAARLAEIGARQAVRDVPRWLDGELTARPQPGAGGSLTRLLTKADGWIDWSRPAVEIERHVRAMWPWPRAWTTIDGLSIQVHQASVAELDANAAEPGDVIWSRKRLIVACSEGALELVRVEPAGRRAMTAEAYLNGRRAAIERLGDVGEPLSRPPLVVPAPS
jgi:methionyl-tRNA formyltransferase